MLDDFYNSHEDKALTRMTPLVWTQILGREPGHPFLKAKAAQARHSAAFCVQLARLHKFGNAAREKFAFKPNSRLGGSTDQHNDDVVLVFEGFADFCNICSAEEFSEQDCERAMFQFLQGLERLNRLWRRGLPNGKLAARMPWNVRPKSHLCDHLVSGMIQMYGSPSAFWCYRDEDFIGVIKRIARNTKLPISLERRVMEKLRIWAALSG
jgi:hypothetical protein